MLRLISILILVGLAQAPLLADDPDDCGRWTVEGLYPGMEFGAAKQLYIFLEETKHRDPLGYRRYQFRAASGPVIIGLHVDVQSDPQMVIGVTHEFPGESFTQLQNRFGEPVHSMVKGDYKIISWWDVSCQMSVKVSTKVKNPELVLGVSLSSNAARSEYKRRKTAAAEAGAAE